MDEPRQERSSCDYISSMPEHEISLEMRFLAENWAALTQESPGWIAVRGSEVVGYDVDPAVLLDRMSEYRSEELLYSYVPTQAEAGLTIRISGVGGPRGDGHGPGELLH